MDWLCLFCLFSIGNSLLARFLHLRLSGCCCPLSLLHRFAFFFVDTGCRTPDMNELQPTYIPLWIPLAHERTLLHLRRRYVSIHPHAASLVSMSATLLFLCSLIPMLLQALCFRPYVLPITWLLYDLYDCWFTVLHNLRRQMMQDSAQISTYLFLDKFAWDSLSLP